MSLGPSEKDRLEPKSKEAVRRVQVFASTAVTAAVTRPSYYLFYGGLAAALVGLYVGTPIAPHYWALLAFVGVLELVRSHTKKSDDKKPDPPGK